MSTPARDASALLVNSPARDSTSRPASQLAPIQRHSRRRQKRAKINENSVIGRGCTIGVGATVNAHLKLWPDKWVSPGSIVSMSLIYGQKWPGSLFGSGGVSGLANLEITPEFALKLGQAFGTWLRPGQAVMTSRDTHPASRVMNRCIISGLLSGQGSQDLLKAGFLPPPSG